jgi:formylglycine-generating enzyme required for sulfatase activity
MVGNVGEWCWDWFDDYSSAAQTNPHGPDSGYGRLTRGGSWDSPAAALRLAVRDNHDPTTADYDFGFRTVLPF